MTPPSARGPLSGYTVLDLTRWLAGPYATSWLGDMGADVIKIERPGTGDDERHIDKALPNDTCGYFVGVNRSKRSMTLDLSKPEGREVLLLMARSADVIIESYRPGTMERLGLGYEDIAEANPRILYCSISAFGQEGPLRDQPGMDIIAQAIGGMMALTGEPGRPPLRAGVPIADLTAAMLSVSLIALGLLARERFDIGQKVSVSLLDGQISLLANYLPGFFVTGEPRDPVGNAHPQIVPYQPFETRDGHVLVACLTEAFWRRFCGAIQLGNLAEDPRFASNAMRCANRGELIPTLEATMRTKSTAHWLDLLRRVDVPCAPINDLAAIVRDPQVAFNGMIVEIDHPLAGKVRIPGNPMKMSSTPARISRPAPLLGEHTDEVLGAYGISAERIAALRRAGAI